jgi:hypothetical protein
VCPQGQVVEFCLPSRTDFKTEHLCARALKEYLCALKEYLFPQGVPVPSRSTCALKEYRCPQGQVVECCLTDSRTVCVSRTYVCARATVELVCPQVESQGQVVECCLPSRIDSRMLCALGWSAYVYSECSPTTMYPLPRMPWLDKRTAFDQAH